MIMISLTYLTLQYMTLESNNGQSPTPISMIMISLTYLTPPNTTLHYNTITNQTPTNFAVPCDYDRDSPAIQTKLSLSLLKGL